MAARASPIAKEGHIRLPFRDRYEAGRVLASRLLAFEGRSDLLILALPRGGVPVAYEVARALEAPLDVFMVRKLGAPQQPELAMGAIATGGTLVLNSEVVQALRITREEIEAEVRAEEEELARREAVYRGARPPPEVGERTVILIDDGLATGSTMKVAVQALRQQDPKQIVGAVPIAAPDVCADLGTMADEMVCAATPQPFYAVGLWYADFSPTTDDEIRDLLQRAAQWSASPAA